VNIGREAKFGRNNIGHLHKVFVPQKQNATSSHGSRALRKASKPITTNVASIKGGHRLEFGLLQTNDMARSCRDGLVNNIFTVLVI
jgi:hypothetical protein